jgi:hypothetical protein
MKLKLSLILFIILPLIITAQITPELKKSPKPYTSEIGLKKPDKDIPLLKERLKKIKSVNLSSPVLLLDNASDIQKLAMEGCLKNADFTKFVKNDKNEILLNEIFGVYPIRPGDIATLPTGPNAEIFRVEMYNFALNLATIGIIDVKKDSILQIYYLSDTQPDIPKTLVDLALQIATHSPEIIQALGYKPDQSEALMSSTKTSLNKTRCERSLHVCVAPTFIKDDKALWAIVDLTDLKIAGIRWTNVGTTGPSLVTERKVQDEFINENFCQSENTCEKKWLETQLSPYNE